jgi:hypothetical protein
VAGAGAAELLPVVLLRSVVVPLVGAAVAAGGGGAVIVVVVVVTIVDVWISGIDGSFPRVLPVVRRRCPLAAAGDEEAPTAVGGTGATASYHHGRLMAGNSHPYGSMLISGTEADPGFCAS